MCIRSCIQLSSQIQGKILRCSSAGKYDTNLNPVILVTCCFHLKFSFIECWNPPSLRGTLNMDLLCLVIITVYKFGITFLKSMWKNSQFQTTFLIVNHNLFLFVWKIIVYSRSPAAIMGSNPTRGMNVCCVLSGRGLCDELITRPEESYWLWCIIMCDQETSWTRKPYPALGCRAREDNKQ
jgi:hypothetical protein